MNRFTNNFIVCLGLISLGIPACTQNVNHLKLVSQDKQDKEQQGKEEHEDFKGLINPKSAPKVPEGVKQLKAMYLDKSLFTPDKWWKYEEADDDRPYAHAVEQGSAVAFGAPLEEKHGAFIRYTVMMLDSAGKAHETFLKMSTPRKVVENVRLTVRPLRKGNESAEIITNIRDSKGAPQQHLSSAYMRFDRYLVVIDSRADMRAIGARPNSGDRKWMSEPVYNSILQAAADRWSKYKILLAKQK